MNNFHGFYKKNTFFEGWYVKHQNETNTFAIIPAFHVDKNGTKKVTLQIITETFSHVFSFPANALKVAKHRFYVRIKDADGTVILCEKGLKIHCIKEKMKIQGTILYQPFTRLSSDIMGPFHWVPFMQCNHGIVSLAHCLSGMIEINDKKMDFNHGIGYIEKDWGNSFPKNYVWTQCSWFKEQNNCVMMAVADIPILGQKKKPIICFTGCICSIWYKGRQYRFATYQGAKVISCTEREIIIKQGKYQLSARLLEGKRFPLRAPEQGSMTRSIHECPSCTVHYTFSENKKTIFNFISRMAGFETVS